METTGEKRRGNFITGTVGAFLGSLIGVICIVLVGQLGYMASVSGLVMAVCAIKGYELLGGGLSKKGAAVSAVLVLVMTYFANQLDWAISVAEVYEAGVIESFRTIGYLLEIGYIEGTAYWGNLVMLYLFTLLGAVPAIIGGLRDNHPPVIPPRQAGEEEAGVVRQIEVYSAQKGWLTRVRVSAIVSIFLPLFATMALLVFSVRAENQVIAPLSALLSVLVVFCLAIPSLVLCQADDTLLVRDANRNLWKISLSRFNLMDTYRFTTKIGTVRALRWGSFTGEEQERAKSAILRAISDLSSGQLLPGSMLSRMVIPLSGLELVREDKWRWKTTYEVSNGRKKLTIPKVYQNFRPTAEAESASGPLPFHWGLTLAAVACVLVFAFGGGVLSYALDGGFQTVAGPVDYTPSGVTRHEAGSVYYEMDNDFSRQDDNSFIDETTGAVYVVTAADGVSEDDALTRLMQPISEHRMDSDFESFQFDYLDADWDSLTIRSGERCRYNLLSVYFKDGRAIHTGVILSDDGTLFVVEASHDAKKDEEAVKGATRFILESANMAQAADIPTDGSKVKITL